MMLGEIHLHPAITAPIVVLLGVLAAGYWRRLARASVPGPRRHLRRAGLLVGGVATFAGFFAISMFDPDHRPTAYLLAWLVVAILLLPAVLLAAADAIFTVRLHQRSLERRLARDAQRIRRAVAASGADAERSG